MALHDDPPSETHPSRRGDGAARALLLVGLLAAGGLSWAVYQPARSAPFDILDFSEFLPLLQGSEGVGSAFDRLVAYYASQGRANVTAYAALASKWHLLGDWPSGWQVARFVQMWLIVALSYRLFRRLGASPVGAAVGASAFLFAPCAVEGWTRLTMGEPTGTMFLLIMCLLAVPPPERPLSRTRIAGVAVALAGLLLTKEMLAPLVVLPVVLAATTHGSASARVGAKQLQHLCLACLVTAILVLVPIASVALGAGTDAYSSAFGRSLRPVSDAAVIWLFLLFPFEPFSLLPPIGQGLLTTTYLLVFALGVHLHLRDTEDSRVRSRIRIGVLLFLPLAAGLVYLPWPLFSRFYGMPYLLAPGAALALAMTAIQRRARVLTAPLALVATTWVAVSAVPAANGARRSWASREMYATITAQLSRRTTVDSIFVATPWVARPAWIGIGATLSRYGNARHPYVPPARDVTCAELGPLLSSKAERSVMMVFGDHYCPPPRRPDSTRVVRFARWNLATPVISRDSVWVQYWSGPVAPDYAVPP